MRYPMLASALSFALATSALAQSETELKKGDDETPAAAGVDGPVDAPEPGGTTSHTVEKGDTLWDLSQKFLGSPWYWPKVWSYNPEIANPHWIYPGNVVRFVGQVEGVPTQVETGEGPTEEVEQAQLIDDDDKVKTVGQIGYKPKNALTVRLEGFVTPKEIEEAGVISASYGESELLSYPQTFYVSFKKKGEIKMGEQYLIYHTATELSHPDTGLSVGFLTHTMGTAKVIRWSDKEKLATMEITSQWDEIVRGDFLGPVGETQVKSVVPRANEKELKGTVVAAARYWYGTFGEHEQMVIDKGSEAGVQQGNTFTIYRQMEGLRYQAILNQQVLDEKYPKEDVGTCMVLDAKAKASTCILTMTIREVVPGDHVEMRLKSNARASR